MLSDPPRDGNGKIIPHDHPEIKREHTVIRHTSTNDLHPVDGNNKRLASGAFSESSGGGMSVDLEVQMTEAGLQPLHYVTNATDGAVRLNVGDLRDIGLRVGYDPDGGHQYHGAVWDIGNGSSRRKKIAKVAVTIRRVSGQTID